MTDQELLKFAAKAYGRPWKWVESEYGYKVPGMLVRDSAHEVDYYFAWNPLEDDGDAFRLSVKMHIHLDYSGCSLSDPAHISALYTPINGRGSSSLQWINVHYIPEEMFTPDYHKQEKFAAYLMDQGGYVRGIESAARRAIAKAAAEIGKTM